MGENENTSREEMDFRAALASAMSDGGEDTAETEAADGMEADDMDVAAEGAQEAAVEGEQVAQNPQEVQNPANAQNQQTAQNPAEAQSAQNPQENEYAGMMRYLMQQNQQLQEQLRQQAGAMQGQSEFARNAVEGAMTEPETPVNSIGVRAAETELPALDMESLRYMSSEDQARAIAEWQTATQEAMLARSKAAVMSEIAPMLEDYKRGQAANALSAARAKVNGDARFADFAGMGEQIDRVMANTPMLESVSDPEQKYIFAGLIARGINNQPAVQKEMSTDEIVALAMSKPDVMKAIETKRAMEIDDGNRAVPKLAGSSGMSQASAIPENAPQSYDDIARLMKSRM